jgi:hypothetical protein
VIKSGILSGPEVKPILEKRVEDFDMVLTLENFPYKDLSNKKTIILYDT